MEKKNTNQQGLLLTLGNSQYQVYLTSVHTTIEEVVVQRARA